MKEIDIIKRAAADMFDRGDFGGLTRLYLVLNDLIAHVVVLRQILGEGQEPDPEPEPEKLELEPYEPPPGHKADLTIEGGRDK